MKNFIKDLLYTEDKVRISYGRFFYWIMYFLLVFFWIKQYIEWKQEFPLITPSSLTYLYYTLLCYLLSKKIVVKNRDKNNKSFESIFSNIFKEQGFWSLGRVSSFISFYILVLFWIKIWHTKYDYPIDDLLEVNIILIFYNLGKKVTPIFERLFQRYDKNSIFNQEEGGEGNEKV